MIRSRRSWGRSLGLVGLVAALAGCGGGDDAGFGGGDAAAAASAWTSLRDAFLRKDWDGVWGGCTPESRQAYEAKFEELKRKVAGGSAEWDNGLRLMDIRKADLKEMDGLTFFKKSMRLLTEGEAFRTSWEKLQTDLSGKRVERVEVQEGGQAVLTLRSPEGKADTLRAQKAGGRWTLHFPLGTSN